LIRRSAVNCATAPLPAAVLDNSSAASFNAWANAAIVLAALGRNLEALSAAEKAGEIIPHGSFVPWLRGNVDYAMGNQYDAEREYLKAIAAKPEIPLFWFSLATVYKHQGRIPETIAAQRKAIELATMPKPYELLKLARLYLDVQQPKAALETFDEAVRVSSPDLLSGSGEHNVQFQADQGRAAAWRALGDQKKASEFDQNAVQDLVPHN
jgi:tetratricopeptide (TPR) repeat protein